MKIYIAEQISKSRCRPSVCMCAEQEWNDYQLMWDKTQFGGIDVLRIMPDKVWTPDIVLFNKYCTVWPTTTLQHSTSVARWDTTTLSAQGTTENAGVENAIRSKMQRWKMQE